MISASPMALRIVHDSPAERGCLTETGPSRYPDKKFCQFVFQKNSWGEIQLHLTEIQNIAP